MRNDEHEGAYIWLRQSARFGLGDQERTVEIAIPVRPGATPEEIEQLLREADAGMERLSLHLDRRIAALTGAAGVPAESAAASPPSLRTPALSTPAPLASQAEVQAAQVAAAPAQPASHAVPPSSPDASPPEEPAAPAASREVAAAAPAAATGEHSGAESPAPHAPARPAASVPSRPEPTAPAPSNAAPRPTAPRATPATPATAAPAPAPAPTRPAAARGPDLTRAEFLAQAAGMGLNPKQVMERLSVRTLEGLNLREALEVLRRQLVRDEGATPAEPDPPAARGAASAPREPAPAAPATTPAYFDEEDDLELSFALPDDEGGELDEVEMDAEYPASMPDVEAGGALGLEGDEPEDLELDDVPELDEPGLAAAPPAPTPIAGRRGPAASTRAAERPQAPTARQRAAAAAEPAPMTGGQPASALRVRAREVLEHLRAEPPGGVAGRDQLMAYRNIVVRELGAQGASALVRGIWQAQPERLGSDQMYALISWGKTDGFAEEARALLGLLRTERAAGEPAGKAEGADAGTASAPSAPGERQAGARVSGRGARSPH